MPRDELRLLPADGRRNILECQANEYEVGLQACPRAQSVSLLALTLRPRPRSCQAHLLASKHIKIFSGWFGASTLLLTNLVNIVPGRVIGNYVESRQLAPGEGSPDPNCTEVGQDSDMALATNLERAAAPVVLPLQRSPTHLQRQCAVRKHFHFRNATCLVNRSSQFEMSKVMAAVAAERSRSAWAQAAVALCKAFCVPWCSINTWASLQLPSSS
eukprot:s711_g15.t1